MGNLMRTNIKGYVKRFARGVTEHLHDTYQGNDLALAWPWTGAGSRRTRRLARSIVEAIISGKPLPDDLGPPPADDNGADDEGDDDEYWRDQHGSSDAGDLGSDQGW